jgi:hypothetical protein
VSFDKDPEATSKALADEVPRACRFGGKIGALLASPSVRRAIKSFVAQGYEGIDFDGAAGRDVTGQ